MADTLGLDPKRIERLRSPDRLEYFHPDRIWEVLKPAPVCTLIDIGAGPGFLTLPFAKRFPRAKVYGCDILEGMVRLLLVCVESWRERVLAALMCTTSMNTIPSWQRRLASERLCAQFVDIDECTDNTHNCSVNANCADMTPGFTCTCDSGYSGDGETCTSKETWFCLFPDTDRKMTSLGKHKMKLVE